MAHLMKANRGQIGGLSRHFERYQRSNGEYIKFNNEEIHTSKTYLNYNLAENKNQLEFIKKRTQEVRCLNRKDVNVMCSWVITKPKEVTQEEQELFFKESYKFLESEYGKENIISAFVHLDETTPHIHFAFVPVVRDKKRGDLKVSAKELITKQYLKSFHPKLEKHMIEVFGRDIGIINEATKEGNKSIEELKRGGAIKELKEIKKELNMIDISKEKIKQLEKISTKERFLDKNNIIIKKNDFEMLIQIAKNYIKDINYHKAENMLLKEENRVFKEKSIKNPMAERILDVKNKSKLYNLERDFNSLNRFIKNEGLADEFERTKKKDRSKIR